MKIAQLRYDESNRSWTLYWADRNQRWHRYWDLDPSESIGVLLDEIDEDPTCIFFADASPTPSPPRNVVPQSGRQHSDVPLCVGSGTACYRPGTGARCGA